MSEYFLIAILNYNLDIVYIHKVLYDDWVSASFHARELVTGYYDGLPYRIITVNTDKLTVTESKVNNE